MRLTGPHEDRVVGARRPVGEEPAASREHPIVLTPPHRAADVPQWSRFSHCHNATEIANEMVISSMIVATIDG